MFFIFIKFSKHLMASLFLYMHFSVFPSFPIHLGIQSLLNQHILANILNNINVLFFQLFWTSKTPILDQSMCLPHLYLKLNKIIKTHPLMPMESNVFISNKILSAAWQSFHAISIKSVYPILHSGLQISALLEPPILPHQPSLSAHALISCFTEKIEAIIQEIFELPAPNRVHLFEFVPVLLLSLLPQ